MKRFLLTFALAGLSTLVHAEVTADGAYVRALPPGVPTSAAYLRLSNDGAADVSLTGAESSVAGKVTLHSTMNHNGMLHMMPAQTLTIPANGELVLQSGGHHLMLEDLATTLVPDTEVDLTLHFSDGNSLTLQVPVRSVLDEQEAHH